MYANSNARPNRDGFDTVYYCHHNYENYFSNSSFADIILYKSRHVFSPANYDQGGIDSPTCSIRVVDQRLGCFASTANFALDGGCYRSGYLDTDTTKATAWKATRQ